MEALNFSCSCRTLSKNGCLKGSSLSFVKLEEFCKRLFEGFWVVTVVLAEVNGFEVVV